MTDFPIPELSIQDIKDIKLHQESTSDKETCIITYKDKLFKKFLNLLSLYFEENKIETIKSEELCTLWNGYKNGKVTLKMINNISFFKVIELLTELQSIVIDDFIPTFKDEVKYNACLTQIRLHIASILLFLLDVKRHYDNVYNNDKKTWLHNINKITRNDSDLIKNLEENISLIRNENLDLIFQK